MDLELYQAIVLIWFKENKYQQVNQTKVNTKQVNTQPRVNEEELNRKRQQASVGKKTKSSGEKKYDPSTLSDEEFMKLLEAGAKFI